MLSGVCQNFIDVIIFSPQFGSRWKIPFGAENNSKAIAKAIYEITLLSFSWDLTCLSDEIWCDWDKLVLGGSFNVHWTEDDEIENQQLLRIGKNWTF